MMCEGKDHRPWSGEAGTGGDTFQGSTVRQRQRLAWETTEGNSGMCHRSYCVMHTQ